METIKNELKNSIIDEMDLELSDRYYHYETKHLDTIVTEWFSQKKELIKLLSKHPNWIPEKFMIQFDTDIERRICENEKDRFVDWLRVKVNGQYDWSRCKQTKEYDICNFISNIHNQFFDDSLKDSINYINLLNENFKLRTNMKASKAIGKICREEGWDKLDGFNQKYAALCDCLNPLKIRRHTCISVNPIDFLLMSNGNSWQSCHYIGDSCEDSGCYSAGTISYMLDKHSFIFYTVDSRYNGNQIEREPKIQRQIFGYNDEVLMQSRLYPQGNDCGAEHVYEDIRAIVQKVIADCLGKANIWIKSKNDVEDVVSKGSGAVCYPDWHDGNPGSKHCSISTLKERVKGKENRKIVLGAEPICVTCGKRHDFEENISCCDTSNYEDGYYCEHCGSYISTDDVYFVDGNPYCEDCVSYCDVCGEYVLNSEINYVDGIDVCDDCLSNSGDYGICNYCEEYHHIDNLTTIEDGSIYCNTCVDRYSFVCSECGYRFDEDNEWYDEETDESYCRDCYYELLEKREEEELITV